MSITNLVGAGADQLRPSGPGELVGQLNRAERWLHAWNVVGWVLVALSLPLAALGAFVFAFVAGPMAFTVGRIGFARFSVALSYEIDGVLDSWYRALSADWSGLASTVGRWRLESDTELHVLYHRKINAGASSLIARHRANFGLKPPRALKGDVGTPTVTAQRHSLVFLPDRILMKSRRRWSDIDYAGVKVRLTESDFVESGNHAVPQDGRQVGQTWKYVNINGGPDRRFKENRVLPVMRYATVTLSSATGLQWQLQFSRLDVAKWLRYILDSWPGGRPEANQHRSTKPRSATISMPPKAALPFAQQQPTRQPAGEPRPTARTKRARPVERVDAYRPPLPTGRPVQPWGAPATLVEVAGGIHFEPEIVALFDSDPALSAIGGTQRRERAALVPDPDNPYGDGHTVAVYVRGRHIGYLPTRQASDYFQPIVALSQRGAVTVDAQVWASSTSITAGFRAKVTLSAARAGEFIPPPTMPNADNAILLPAGDALQVIGEQDHLSSLMPHLGQPVAATLHTVVVTRAGGPTTLVEIRIEGNAIGRFSPATSAKVAPLVERVERSGGLPVARAVVRGNTARAGVTVYVARAGDLDEAALSALSG